MYLQHTYNNKFQTHMHIYLFEVTYFLFVDIFPWIIYPSENVFLVYCSRLPKKQTFLSTVKF